MSIHSLFSDNDLARIREETRLSESRHGGEIVPYLIGRADDYAVARWRVATVGAVLSALIVTIFYTLAGNGGASLLVWLLLPVLAGAGIGYMLASLPGVGRVFLGKKEMDQRVRWRAEVAFLDEEVFNTRDRTGILIFLSIYERRAVILADEGINKSIPEGKWQSLVDDLVGGICRGEAAEALCETIRSCTLLLHEYEVIRRDDDQNELHDHLRIEDR